MTNLTKNEIVELRARAMELESEGSWMGWYDVPSQRKTFDELHPDDQELFRKYAQATIEADEKAGVLKLVEEGKSATQNLIDYDNWYRKEYNVSPERETIHGELHQKGFRAFLAGRPSTPVYQTAKEGK